MSVRKIYDDTGYLSADTLYRYNTFLTFVIGARGIGKTFNMLRYAIEHRINTIYVRRTKDESDIASGKEANVLSEVCEMYGYTYERTEGAEIPTFIVGKEGEECARICFAALTTFHKVRSVGFHHYDMIIYDEFIPEKIARKIKHEADAFNNMIETVNRNRELVGRPPVKVFCLSNSNNIYNDILAHYNLIKNLTKMQESDQEIFVDRKRSITLVYPKHSPISEAKKQTALYKAMQGSDASYANMALENQFDDNLNKPFIKPQPLKEYVPRIKVGKLTVYEHKSELKMYVSKHYSGNVRKLDINSENMRYFRQSGTGKKCIFSQLLGLCYFEDAPTFLLFKEYMNIA